MVATTHFKFRKAAPLERADIETTNGVTFSVVYDDGDAGHNVEVRESLYSGLCLWALDARELAEFFTKLALALEAMDEEDKHK